MESKNFIDTLPPVSDSAFLEALGEVIQYLYPDESRDYEDESQARPHDGQPDDSALLDPRSRRDGTNSPPCEVTRIGNSSVFRWLTGGVFIGLGIRLALLERK